MGSRLERILQSRCIALDTNVFIYALEGNTDFPMATELLMALALTETRVVTSVLTVLEMTVPLFQLHEEQRLPDYLDFMNGQGRIIVAEIDQSIALLAAKIRGAYRLKTPDAIHLATGLACQAEVFVTADRDYGLRKVEGMKIEVLRPNTEK